MILYHGTNADFDAIDLSQCAPHKDLVLYNNTSRSSKRYGETEEPYLWRRTRRALF